jgi:hypothetical protein
MEKNKGGGNLEASQKKMSIFKSRKCICGDCQECFKDFTYFLSTFSISQGIPEISAKSWCIWHKSYIFIKDR